MSKARPNCEAVHTHTHTHTHTLNQIKFNLHYGGYAVWSLTCRKQGWTAHSSNQFVYVDCHSLRSDPKMKNLVAVCQTLTKSEFAVFMLLNLLFNWSISTRTLKWTLRSVSRNITPFGVSLFYFISFYFICVSLVSLTTFSNAKYTGCST